MPELPLPPLPKFLIDMIIEDASTPKLRYAIRYLTSTIVLPIDPEPIKILFPGGMGMVTPTESSVLQPVPEYWRVWQQTSEKEYIFRIAKEFFISDLHNYNISQGRISTFTDPKLKREYIELSKWQPKQIVERTDKGLKVLVQLDTPEQAEKWLKISRKEATRRVNERLTWESHGF